MHELDGRRRRQERFDVGPDGLARREAEDGRTRLPPSASRIDASSGASSGVNASSAK